MLPYTAFMCVCSLLCLTVRVCNCTELGYCYIAPEERALGYGIGPTIGIIGGTVGFCSESPYKTHTWMSDYPAHSDVITWFSVDDADSILILLLSRCSYCFHHSDQTCEQKEQEDDPGWRRREGLYVVTHKHIFLLLYKWLSLSHLRASSSNQDLADYSCFCSCFKKEWIINTHTH